MPIRTALWKVGALPQLLGASSLAREQQLEDMIVAAPGLVSDEWMLIGRQADTGFGGRIDLLAIAPLVPVEWIQTVPLEQAIQEVGMFGNQNTVCKPTTPK